MAWMRINSLDIRVYFTLPIYTHTLLCIRIRAVSYTQTLYCISHQEKKAAHLLQLQKSTPHFPSFCPLHKTPSPIPKPPYKTRRDKETVKRVFGFFSKGGKEKKLKMGDCNDGFGLSLSLGMSPATAAGSQNGKNGNGFEPTTLSFPLNLLHPRLPFMQQNTPRNLQSSAGIYVFFVVRGF